MPVTSLEKSLKIHCLHETTRSIPKRRPSWVLGAASVAEGAKSFEDASRSRSRQRPAHAHFVGVASIGTIAKRFNPWPPLIQMDESVKAKVEKLFKL
jgi:hypothetical protein